jgi:hypothetical protein
MPEPFASVRRVGAGVFAVVVLARSQRTSAIATESGQGWA